MRKLKRRRRRAAERKSEPPTTTDPFVERYMKGLKVLYVLDERGITAVKESDSRKRFLFPGPRMKEQ